MQANSQILKIKHAHKFGFKKALLAAGSLAGLGFGIFSSVKNFDPDNHQSHDMNASTRYFSELLTQIGIATLQSTSLGLMSSVLGYILDAYTNEKFSKIYSTEEVVCLSDVQPDISTHLLAAQRPAQP